jgi:hypothetical protein
LNGFSKGKKKEEEKGELSGSSKGGRIEAQNTTWKLHLKIFICLTGRDFF